MIECEIPGQALVSIAHLVLDFNGTLAVDGCLITGVAQLLEQLAAHVQVHVLTADTTGTCRSQVAGLPVTVSVLDRQPQDEAKQEYVAQLGMQQCACIGNGRNDGLMLTGCALGIAIIGPEGAAPATLAAADVVVPDIAAALGLLRQPLRLKATLRN